MELRPAQMILRVIFIINLILGILFWTNHAVNIVWLHMLLGIVFVIALFYIGVVAAIRTGNIGLQMATWLLGLALAVVGLLQRNTLNTPIQILHLLLALAAIGVAEMAGARAAKVSARTA